MLSHLKLNQKLLLLVVVPLLVVSYFAANQTLNALSLRDDTDSLAELAALGTRISALVHELQKERGASAGFLGSKGAKFGPQLAKQRQETDQKAEQLEAFLGGFSAENYNEGLRNDLKEAVHQLRQIDQKRGLVDRFELPLKETLKYYTGMNGQFLGLISEMSKISPDEKLSITTAAYAAFLQSKERAGIERAVLSNTFAKNAFGPGMFHRFLNLVTTQNNYMEVYLSLANDEQIRFYQDTMKGEAIEETTRMRRVARTNAETGGFDIDAVYWFQMQTAKINLLKKVEDRLAEDLRTASAALLAEANTTLILNIVLSVLAVVLTLFTGWLIGQNILRQLGGEPAYIVEIADQIARGKLDALLKDEGSSEKSGIYASIVSMRDNIRARIEQDEKTARETRRIKTALDCVNTNVMVADDQYNIIYMNNAVQAMFREAAGDLREFIPGFDPDQLMGQNIDAFHKEPGHQRRLLERLSDTTESTVTVGPRTFRIIANPVVDDAGKRLGTAVEWSDLTERLALETKEQQRLEEERRHAAENTRIRNALDNVSSCVMMADPERNIIYMNKTVQELFRQAESDIRHELPGFDANKLLGANIDDFHKSPGHQATLLDNLTRAHESTLEVGGRTMKIIANPVFDDQGERLGTAVEWADRTAEVAVENEVDKIVEAASNGDLSQRISTGGKQGFFLELGNGINRLISVVEAALNDIAGVMDRVSNGDLTRPIERDYHGTYGQVKTGVNTTIHKLQEIVSDLRRSSDVISTASGEISSGSTHLSRRTEQNAASLQETAASMEQLTSTVRNNADNAAQANQVAANARQTAEKGGEVVGHAIQAMQEINASSSKIAEIIGVIDEIAFQTNLLALNASVEAARAGEQGRGFAVVATEVRNLASRSAKAAKEIKDLIHDSGRKVQSGSALVNESGETLEEIVVGVKKVADIIAEITAASAEQSAGIDQINQAVTSMDEGTQQNASLAEQTSAAAASLNEKASQMNGLINFFEIIGAPARDPSPKVAAAPKRPAPPPVAAPPPPKAPAAPKPVAAAKTRVTIKPEPADDDEWEEF